MANHMHLPMTSPNDRPSVRLMKGLGQRDVQHIIAPIVKPGCSSKGASDGDEARPSGYRGRVADALRQDMPRSIRGATNGHFVPGSRRFQQQIATMVDRRMWPGTPGQPRESSADTDQLDLAI
jgi:hypothetical protein